MTMNIKTFFKILDVTVLDCFREWQHLITILRCVYKTLAFIVHEISTFIRTAGHGQID